MTTNSDLIGVPQLARELGVDQSTIHRRIAADRLQPAAYAGKHALFTLDDVERLKRGEQTFPAEAKR